MLLRVIVAFIVLVVPTIGITDRAVVIVDGDTLRIGDVAYRLDGIDAPEAGQKCLTERGKRWACGEAAMDWLAEFLNHGALRCYPTTRDGYGRTIATCFAGDTDMGKEMVRSGAAWAFVKYSTVYVAEEAEARSKRRGIWKGSAQPAWEFRADRWRVAEQKAPDGCPIKGNISKNGRIYHAPWSPWYSRTKVSPKKGERWFCSEAEAVAAGWRTPAWR